MASLPYYKFYPADHRTDTVLLSVTADGLYRRLLDAYWLADGDLPDDPFALAKLCNIHLRSFRRLWPEISRYFPTKNGRITNPRMDRELAQARDRSAQTRSAANSRWNATALRSNNQIHKPFSQADSQRVNRSHRESVEPTGELISRIDPTRSKSQAKIVQAAVEWHGRHSDD